MDDGPQTLIKTLLAVIKNSAVKAPANIVKWGYAALFFSGIAALVLSFVSADKFKYLVVTVVLVLALALALWALDAFMRSQVRWVRMFANVFAVVMVLLITSGGVYVAYWAIKEVTDKPVAPVAQATLSILSASAVRIRWVPSTPTHRVVVTVRKADEVQSRRVEAEASAGGVDVEGLSPATRYQFTLVASTSDRDSPIRELEALTHADNLQVKSRSASEYAFTYSGPLDQISGRPSDSVKLVSIVIGDALSGEVGLKGGDLDGEATLASKSGIQHCEVTFHGGEPTFNSCALNITSRPPNFKSSWDSSTVGRYLGSVRLAAKSETGGAVQFGPFRLIMSGSGSLVGPQQYSEKGHFRDGLLQDGHISNKRISEQALGYYTVNMGALQGPFMNVGPYVVSIGVIENERMRAGFELNASPTRNGKQVKLAWEPWGAGKGFGSVYLEKEDTLVEGGCDSKDYLNVISTQIASDLLRHTFPLANPSIMKFEDWTTGCYNLSNGVLSCRVDSEALSVVAKKSATSPPELTIELSLSPTAIQEFSVGGVAFRAKERGRPIVEEAPLAIAMLCTAGLNVRNAVSNKVVSSNKFCQAAAAMFARLYICAPDSKRN